MWRFMELLSAQGITLIVSIMLARMLTPQIYGTLALTMVFINLLNVFIDNGLGVALIQKKNADETDFSSVFWFNLLMCIILYFIVYVFAPHIANLYHKSEIIRIIRLIGLVIIVSAIKNIQQVYVMRNLLFKKFFFATLVGTIGAAIIGILMAYYGFGVYALVSQYIFNAVVDTIILWFTVQWRPKFVFSYTKFKTLFSYSWKILISRLIDTIFIESKSLIIGKFYSEENLAYYSKGMQFPQFAISNITTSMNSILFPTLAQKQNDVIAMKYATKRVIRISSLFIWPSMIGLIAVSKNLITVILTEKWLPTVPFLQILCLGYALEPLQTTNLNVIKALGRSGLFLKMEIIKKTIAITIVILSSFLGVKMIAIGSTCYAFIASFINAFPNKKLISYSYGEQLKDISPFVFMSLIMGIVVYVVGETSVSVFSAGIYISFIFQIACGILTYAILCRCFAISEWNYCVNIIKRTISKKRG